MKKIVVLLLLLASLVPLSAMDSQIGVSIAPEWFWVTAFEGNKAPESTGATSFYLTVDGANYFGENGGFGIEYGLGMAFPINTWAGDMTTEANGDVEFAFRVGAGYRHEFNSLIGIAAGLGLNGSSYSQTGDTGYGYTGKASIFSLGIYGRVAVDFTFIDFLRINAGVAMGGPVYSSMKVSSMGQSMSMDIDLSGFYLAPFVGVSYAY